jgi:hypothetical protein
MIGMDRGVMVRGGAAAIAFLYRTAQETPPMNAFPLLAAFTLCVSALVLHASFRELTAAPVALDADAKATLLGLERAADLRPGRWPAVAVRRDLAAADEGLLDHELASADPVQAWLDRYLTPTAE